MAEHTATAGKVQSGRRYDLDWLRVAAILTVFLYHSTRFFDLGEWHIKNGVTYLWVSWVGSLATQWMMPLIFVISGASCFYALRHGRAGAGPGAFLGDKVRRLLVPLLVGIFTFSIIQVYLERLTHGQFHGSLLAFLPHYFQGLYMPGGSGNFAFAGMHLWYLQILFLFMLVLLPLFWWMRGSRGSHMLRRIGDFFALPGTLFIIVLISTLTVYVEDHSALLQALSSGGWSMLPYLWFFLAGYLIFSHEGVQRRIRQVRWLCLGLTLALIALPIVLRDDPRMTRDLTAWAGIFAILGFASQHLNRSNRFLAYANEAVLPFYILHQNVLLWIGYFVVRWAIPDAARYALILIGSFAAIMLLYEYLVRRTGWLRILFGMKPLAPLAQPAEQAQAIRSAGG